MLKSHIVISIEKKIFFDILSYYYLFIYLFTFYLKGEVINSVGAKTNPDLPLEAPPPTFMDLYCHGRAPLLAP